MNNLFKEYLKNSDALLISSYANIIYLIGNFGFSETERECFLLITRDKMYIITDKRYSEAVKKQIKGYEVIDTGANYFLRKNAKELVEKNKLKKIGFEENNLTVSEYSLLKKFVKLVPLGLSDLRVLKSKAEIENIKLACRIGDATFKFIASKLKTGVSEKQIANEIELFIKNKGGEISFKPVVAFGKNSSIPHHLSGFTKLKQNQIVLLDFGVKINNYCSDMSRTIFFGSATAEFKRIHKIVLEAQEKAIQYINNFYSSSEGTYRPVHPEVEKPALSKTNAFSASSNNNLLARDIDKVARDYITSNNYPNIPHSVGHGVGVEVHEAPHISPISKAIIKPDMVFSIEPGIYIEGYGGVRIEDLAVVTKKGAELISHSNRGIIEL